jgi:hypothetical protein
MEKTQLTVAELSSLLRMIQVIPDSDNVGRIHQMLLAFCTSWRTIGMRRAMLFNVDERARLLRGHLAVERRADDAAAESASFEALARRVVESTNEIDTGDLTLRARTFTVPLDWQRCGAVKAVSSGVPVLADRRLTEFASDPFFDFFQAATYIAIPLRIRGRVTSVLVADNGDSGAAIGVEDISLVYSISTQAANAIEQLVESTDNARKFRVLRKLQDVLASVEDTRRFGDALSAMLSIVSRAVGSNGALLKDLVRNKTLHVRSVDDIDESERDADLAVTECFDDILERTAGTMKPVRGDSGHALLNDAAAARLHHFLAIPLVAGGECLGAVAFYVEAGVAAVQAEEFPARDRVFLELCAGMLAERLDSLRKAEHGRRMERMLEEARANWTREKSAARAGARAQEQVEVLYGGMREIREAVRATSPAERRVEMAQAVVERVEAEVEEFRNELARMQSSLEMVDLFALAREVFDRWAPVLRATGVEVTERVPADGPGLLMHRDSVCTALDAILRVLSTHVSRGDRVLFECSSTAGKAVLLVADTAGKVDGTLLSRLFMPFGGAGGEDDDDPQAAMAAAGDILQRHAGEITVKSSPSWKTILAVSFPVSSNRDRRNSRRDRRRPRADRRSAG